MKNSGFTQQRRPMLGKYRLAWAILTLTSLFFVQNLWGQGGACGSITFSFEQYEPCKFRARYQNGTDCYSEVRYILESGTFESWNVNAAAGFTVDVISPSELWVHHVNGFLPLGNQAPLLFTLPTDLNTTMYVAYLDDCFQVGCEVLGGFPIESCPDPMDASIIGVKYKECGSLPYGNQTPLGGWTIQAIDALGNIKEGVTEADGTYAIYDLPKGQYIVREVQQPGWTPKVPISGEVAVTLAPSQQRIVNFGNCPPPLPPCDCPAGTVPGGNAVVNGNFSGSGGFTTGYAQNNNNPPLQPGQYWIGSNPSAINSGFAACGDHTTGGGNMMVVNGATSQNTTIWSQTFTIIPNSTYKFEAWVASLSSTSPAQVGVIFMVGNNLFGGLQIFAPVQTCSWERLCNEWYNFNATSVTVILINQNIASVGNDFAIDDISFRRCSPPIGDLSGHVYRTCDAEPYGGQPGLDGATVQVLDTMFNLIVEQVSDSTGGYAFYDLPPGHYWIKTVLPPDFTPSLPPSGQALVVLEAGDMLVQDFGLCRSPCPCTAIFTNVEKISAGPGCCCYRLIIDGASIGADCFEYFNIQVDAGLNITSWNITQPGWTVSQIDPQFIQLVPPGGIYPGGASFPITFCVGGGNPHNMIITAGYQQSSGAFECDKSYTFSCPECVNCPIPSGLTVVDLGPNTVTIRAQESPCIHRYCWFIEDSNGNATFHYTYDNTLQLGDLTAGETYALWAFALCDSTNMSASSDTITFNYPCFGGYTDCPGNLLNNGGFEQSSATGFPNAADQIGLCPSWQQASNASGVTGVADWFFRPNSFGLWQGSYHDVPNQQYTLLDASCGFRYAGFDLASCEGFSAQLTSTINIGNGYQIGFWWTPKEPVTSNFTFLAILSNGPCTMTAPNGGTLCGHQCGGDFHVPVTVTPSHVPGTWYFHTFTANAPMTVNYLTFTAQSSAAPVNNYIYVDEVCVRKVLLPCWVAKPKIAYNPQQPIAFFGEAEIGAGSTVLSVIWDFGDGTQDTSCCLGGVIHDYAAAGTYEVCMEVIAVDTSGATCSARTCITADVTVQNDKCDKVAAFLIKSPLDDCCFDLFIHNTEPNCFTQLDLTLSSGDFSQSVFGPGWNVAINGNTATLTPSAGGFIGTGQDLPITLCDPNGTEPYQLQVDFHFGDPLAGGVCGRNFDFDCSGLCTCNGFSNVYFTGEMVPPPAPTPASCDSGSPVTLPCIASDALYNVWGNFSCSNGCLANIQYYFYDYAQNLIQSGIAHFDPLLSEFNLNPGFKFVPGTYQLVLVGQCGATSTCSCTIDFIVPPCGCCSPDKQTFEQTIANEVVLSLDPAQCKAALNIGNLPCQRVDWINWGDGTILQGPFLSGAMPMHAYSQSGNYTVTYAATEINPSAGTGCFQKTITETITMACDTNCYCGYYELEMQFAGAPSLAVSCGDTITLAPNQTFTLDSKFFCQGINCGPGQLVTWNLEDPLGNNTGSSDFAMPNFSVSALSPGNLNIPGTYTLTMYAICGLQDTCWCVLYFKVDDPCCTDQATFLATAQAVQTFGTLGTCDLSFQAQGLTNCMQISYDWGDNTSSGPFADNVPVSHTYAQTGTYTVCHTIEAVSASGAVCHTYQSCEEVYVICDDCVCGSFSELYARPTVGAQSIALDCGGHYTFGCPNPGFNIPITGKFECQGSQCNAATTINWALSGPSGNHSGTVQAGPYFFLPISPLQYAGVGTYTLTLTGNCGTQPCPPCIITFEVNCPDPCPCDPIQAEAEAKLGFAQVLWGCKGCFSPIGLNECDMVQWSLDGGAVIQMTNGTQSFCHDFGGSGTHTVTMTVTRKKSDGTECAKTVVSQTVHITCISLPDCNSSVYANPRFSENPISGGLSSGGEAPGWKALTGNPVLEEGVPGSHDAWSMLLSGKGDEADVLALAEPICLQKSTGTVTLRIRRPGVLNTVNFGCKISVQLFRGEDFMLEHPYWNPIRCLRMVSLDLTPIGSDWADVTIPYDISGWNVLDSCGSAPHGVLVRPIVYVTNALGEGQGGEETKTRAQVDNLCFDGTLVSVQTLSKTSSLRLYPNPNSGTFTLELPAPATQSTSLRITDLAGRTLLAQPAEPGSTRQTLRADALPNGLYFLQVVSEGRVMAVERFVKQ